MVPFYVLFVSFPFFPLFFLVDTSVISSELKFLWIRKILALIGGRKALGSFGQNQILSSKFF